MNIQMRDFILSIVSGLVTNGIQGVYSFITKETIQTHITNAIETVQKEYEDKFNLESDSLFVWQDNIEYFAQWLQEGFLPREDIVLPCPYGNDKRKQVPDKELRFICSRLDMIVRRDKELCSLHASIICDEIYRMLAEKDKDGINQDYYNYVRSYGDVLFLHKADGKKAITLKDTYVVPAYKRVNRNRSKERVITDNMLELLRKFSDDRESRVMIIEGDAGVGKSSLISHVCYLNEVELKNSGQGIFGQSEIYCVRLRNLTMSKGFVEVPISHIIESLGFQTDTEYDVLSKKAVILLDGFDELCMIDGMTDFAEQVLAEIIRGFSDNHIIITTRPKFIDVSKLIDQGIYTDIEYVILKHFDYSKRKEWIEKYKVVCSKEEYSKLEKIENIKDDDSEGICDTPLALYMLAAGHITDEAWNNPWFLYHQIFHVELSATEYNKIFSKTSYVHGIEKYKDILYRVSAEIAYKMYTTGNKKLYVTESDIEKIVEQLDIDKPHIGTMVTRCYALCNYWKNDGKRGVAEFYHNNIRDFFLCEKIYMELEKIYKYYNEDCIKDEYKCEVAIERFISFLGNLFLYSELNDKVSEFIYYRSLYKMHTRTQEEFLKNELKYQFMPYFFERMFVHGAIHDYAYDRDRNMFQENINVLKCIVQIYRHIYEPYVVTGNKRLEWFLNMNSELSEMEWMPYLFKLIFIRTPLTISNQYSIPVAGYANFNLFDMKKADLRYGMFNYSKFIGCDFTNTILYGTDFTGSILKNCNFENADFRFSSLREADIKGCRFENCDLAGTTLPDGYCSNENKEQLEHIKNLI